MNRTVMSETRPPAGAVVVGTSTDQVSRLLSLVPYLQSRGEVSVEEAAREFGVSAQVITADVKTLIYCGLPGLGMGDLIDLDFDAFEDESVIRLSNADYLTRPLRLGRTEAAALIVGLRQLLEVKPSSDGHQAAEQELVARTLAKIEAVAGQSAADADVIAVVPSAAGVEAPVRSQLETALAERKQVRISHRSELRDSVSTRIVDVIAMANHGGYLYVDAWCHSAQDRRLFRADRIAQAEVLDANARDHALSPVDLSSGPFDPTQVPLSAVVELQPAGRWVAEYLPVSETEELSHGRLRVVLPYADENWLVRLALRLGSNARIVEPTHLAGLASQRAAAALSLY